MDMANGHYVWFDIELPNPSKITNLRMWAKNNSDHRFPRKFQWYAQSCTQLYASSYTTSGDYVQPNANDLATWTSITSLWSGTITAPGSNTPTTSNYTYDQAVSDVTYYDRIRLVVVQGSSGYASSGGFIIGEIQINGSAQIMAVSSLSAIGNVSTTAPSDGQALVYDTSNSQWQPGTVATSVALNDLTDVSASGPSGGQSLVYDSTTNKWEPSNLITVSNNPGDVVSYDNQASSSNWSIITGSFADGGVTWASHHGALYDNDTTNDTANRVFFKGNNPNAVISSSNFVEIEYTPTESKIITRLLLWGRSLGSTGSFPKTVYIYGKNGTTYTELGAQTNSTAVVPGDTPTDNLAQIDFSFNSFKTFYEAYKLKITETVSSSSSITSVIIGELNFRGFNRETSISNLSNIGNVSTTAPSDGQALVYNSSNQWVPSRTLLPFGWQVTLYGWTASYTTTGTSGSGAPYYFTFPMPTTSGTSDVGSTSTVWGINKYGNYMDTNATYDEMLLEANTRYFLTLNFNINTTVQRRYHRLELVSSSSSGGTKTILKQPCSGGADRSSSTMYQNLAQSFTFETGSTAQYVQLRTVSEHQTNTYHGNGEPNKNEINIFKV
jgi:hypothetical protein